VKRLLLIKPIESLVPDPSTSTVIWIHLPRSKSGLATLLTVRISADLIRMMVDLNQSYKVESLGEAVTDATIHFLHRDDRESTWPQPTGWLAI